VVAREGIPGAHVPLTYIICGVAVLLAARVVLAVATYAQNPCEAPPGEFLRLVLACTGAIIVLATPLLLLVWYSVRKALPTRPAFCGLLAGLAAGVAAETLWRLHCPYSDLAHVLTTHIAPLALLAGIGAFLVRKSLTRP
jgi:hypothetical protein